MLFPHGPTSTIRYTLGPWNKTTKDTEWKCFFCPETKNIYQRKHKGWEQYFYQRTKRARHSIYWKTTDTTLPQLPQSVQPCTIQQSNNQVLLTGTRPYIAIPPVHTTVIQYIANLPTQERWPWRYTTYLSPFS